MQGRDPTLGARDIGELVYVVLVVLVHEPLGWELGYSFVEVTGD
jgi:hypothetical protein